MFTANLAGSASSHLRPYDTRKDCHSSNSRLNLYEGDQGGELEDAKKRLNGGPIEDRPLQETTIERLEVDPEQLQAILNERRRQRFMKDYKTWAYLGFCALVVIGSIVLIVLAALGQLKS